MKGANLACRLLLLMVVIVMAASPVVASDAAVPRSEEEILRNRVDALWQAKKTDNWEVVYGMADQKFRKTVSLNKFLRGKTLVVMDYSISKVTVDPADPANGVSVVSFKTIVMGRVMNPSVSDKWLNEDGIWNVKLSDPVTPFGAKTK